MHGRGYSCDRSNESRPFMHEYRRHLFHLRPTGLSHTRPLQKNTCYGCHQLGQLLRNRHDRDRQDARLQHYIALGDTAAYTLDHEDEELDDAGHEVMEYLHAAYD